VTIDQRTSQDHPDHGYLDRVSLSNWVRYQALSSRAFDTQNGKGPVLFPYLDQMALSPTGQEFSIALDRGEWLVLAPKLYAPAEELLRLPPPHSGPFDLYARFGKVPVTLTGRERLLIDMVMLPLSPDKREQQLEKVHGVMREHSAGLYWDGRAGPSGALRLACATLMERDLASCLEQVRAALLGHVQRCADALRGTDALSLALLERNVLLQTRL
jgi:hypothetical protein